MDAQSYTTTLGALFGADATNGQYITGTVTYTIGGTTGTVAASSWTTKQVTIPGGVTSVNVTIKDGTYCNTTSGTVKLTAPTAVAKWTAKSGLAYEVDAGAGKTLTLGDIFSAHSSNGQYIAGTVTYNVEGQGDKTVSSSAWATTQVTFPEGGTYTVTIKDNNYSTTTEATSHKPPGMCPKKITWIPVPVFHHSAPPPPSGAAGYAVNLYIPPSPAKQPCLP